MFQFFFSKLPQMFIKVNYSCGFFFKDNEQHICNGKFKLLYYNGDYKFHWYADILSVLCLKYITVTAPGQSFNVKVGNRGREQKKGKKKEGGKESKVDLGFRKTAPNGYKCV